MKLKHKLSAGIIVLLCVIGLTFFLVVNRQATNLVNESLTQKLSSILGLGQELLDEVYPGHWRRENDRLYKGDQLINGKYQVVDIIRAQTGALATIFLDDTRIATNVTLENGARALGTKAAPEVVQTVLINGRDFTGKAEVAGRPFLTRYTPLRDASGRVIGMWFVGVEEKQAYDLIRNLNVSLGHYYHHRYRSGHRNGSSVYRPNAETNPPPPQRLPKAAAGDLTVSLPVMTKDEIGELAAGFNQLIIQQREFSSKPKPPPKKSAIVRFRSPPAMKTSPTDPRRGCRFRGIIRHHGGDDRLDPTGLSQRPTSQPLFADNPRCGKRRGRSNRQHDCSHGTDLSQQQPDRRHHPGG